MSVYVGGGGLDLITKLKSVYELVHSKLETIPNELIIN